MQKTQIITSKTTGTNDRGNASEEENTDLKNENRRKSERERNKEGNIERTVV